LTEYKAILVNEGNLLGWRVVELTQASRGVKSVYFGWTCPLKYVL